MIEGDLMGMEVHMGHDTIRSALAMTGIAGDLMETGAMITVLNETSVQHYSSGTASC